MNWQEMVESVKGGPVPRYYQLKEFIRERIRSGEWAPGRLIPSERELCERYGISRMTARQSITELVNEGLLYREQGKGTYVGQPKIPQQLMSLTGFTEDMRAREQRPGARVLEAEMWAADEVTAEALADQARAAGLPSPAFALADAEPLAIETSCVSFIGCERLLDNDLEHDSLYRILTEVYDMPPVAAEQEIEAGLVGPRRRGCWRLRAGSPVLRTRRVTTTRRNQPIEYARRSIAATNTASIPAWCVTLDSQQGRRRSAIPMRGASSETSGIDHSEGVEQHHADTIESPAKSISRRRFAQGMAASPLALGALGGLSDAPAPRTRPRSSSGRTRTRRWSTRTRR